MGGRGSGRHKLDPQVRKSIKIMVRVNRSTFEKLKRLEGETISATVNLLIAKARVT